MNNDEEFWNMLTDEMMKMSNDEFKRNLNDLREYISLIICDQLDAMESEITNFDFANSILKNF
jgi:hypothetical protein